jgi:type II secretory pathway predicted ATPase ExeA
MSRSYYGFSKDFYQAGYFETQQSQQIVNELAREIKSGKLVAISGIVGCGKTTLLRRIRDTLGQDNEILVSQSLSVEKNHLTLPVLIDALFYDLETANDFRIPRQLQRREQSVLMRTSWASSMNRAIGFCRFLIRSRIACSRRCSCLGIRRSPVSRS